MTSSTSNTAYAGMVVSSSERLCARRRLRQLTARRLPVLLLLVKLRVQPLLRQGAGRVGRAWLLDHLIRSQQQRLRDRQPQRLRGLHVDDEFELGGLLDGKIAGLGSFEDLVDENRCTPPHVGNGSPVGDEPPGLSKSSVEKYRW